MPGRRAAAGGHVRRTAEVRRHELHAVVPGHGHPGGHREAVLGQAPGQLEVGDLATVPEHGKALGRGTRIAVRPAGHPHLQLASRGEVNVDPRTRADRPDERVAGGVLLVPGPAADQGSRR